jgi:hypothetical protein
VSRRLAVGAALLGVGLIADAAPGAEWRLRGLFDARIIAGFDGVSWLDRGFDRGRFGDGDGPLVWGAGLLDFDARVAPTWRARFTLAGYDTTRHPVDWTEAFVEYTPIPRSAWRFKARAGAFYPPVSLENTGPGWTSPYTVGSSAIDTWIGEEVRSLGLEASATRMGQFTGSSTDWTLFAAAVRANDPLGALLAWRGFTLGDRQSGWRDRLPFADLPNFRPGGMFFPVQQAWEEPFKEIDGNTGYYAGAEWAGQTTRLRYLHYDNLGDPSVVEGGQWCWRTQFEHLGWQLRLADGSDLLAQALHGDTEMDGFNGPLVYAKFDAAYLLWSRAWTRHRVSARADLWAVRDTDATPRDPNQEHGRAFTGAYFYEPPARSRFGGWRAGLELRALASDRPARRLFGAASRRRENTAELSLQWRF